MRLTRRLFFFGFGLTALVAVGSYWWQVPGLAGPQGIAPIADGMEGLRRSPALGFFDVPTLLWLSSSMVMVHLLCALSCLSAVLLVVGLAPRVASLVLWACWLSLVQVGHPFLAFQWDVLLIETAFCAALYAPSGLRPRWDTEPLPALRFVMAVLACKVTLESGIVKLASGDPTWRDLTALTYHWWSQPLPTWTSVWLNELPLAAQQVMCALMFVLELGAPLMLFGPQAMRRTGAIGLMALQAALFAAGNYSFYNVLTFMLAVPLLGRASAPTPRSGWRWAIAFAYAALSVALFFGRSLDSRLLSVVRRFDTVNKYGAFAVMTTTRPEIVLEGSADGVTWVAYEFPWKPGALDRRPGFVAPWQPRLDWQMWFAALGNCESNPWVLSLQQRLLENAAPVVALFETTPPFTPKFLRTREFEYRFAPLGERGVWWVRTETGPYCPAVTLGPNGQLQRAF